MAFVNQPSKALRPSDIVGVLWRGCNRVDLTGCDRVPFQHATERAAGQYPNGDDADLSRRSAIDDLAVILEGKVSRHRYSRAGVEQIVTALH